MVGNNGRMWARSTVARDGWFLCARANIKRSEYARARAEHRNDDEASHRQRWNVERTHQDSIIISRRQRAQACAFASHTFIRCCACEHAQQRNKLALSWSAQEYRHLFNKVLRVRACCSCAWRVRWTVVTRVRVRFVRAGVVWVVLCVGIYVWESGVTHCARLSLVFFTWPLCTLVYLCLFVCEIAFTICVDIFHISIHSPPFRWRSWLISDMYK